MEYSLKNLLFTVLSLFIIASCSSSENTIVIEEAPTSGGQADTSQQGAKPLGSFKQLTIGENQRIQSLDPLFVQNDAGRRALQLVYEGLVRFNEKGTIEPAIAQDWSVSNGKRTYRFTLNNELFYHDSNIFPNGRGRRLVAADVKKVFERMAKLNVPNRAAQLFMNIKGFEPYYREQHQIMRASERQLDGISGIRTPNDSTVVFSLVRPDEQFLNKLASPYAVIYPPEAVKTENFKPVGTGPFAFSQQRADSMYIFSRFDNYRIANQPKINRVDIVTSNNEASLLNAMGSGDIQLIPELGPRQMQMIHDSAGSLKSSLQNEYMLYENRQAAGYHLRYNTGADMSEQMVANALATVQNHTFFSDLPAKSVEVLWALPKSGGGPIPDSLRGTYSDNPYVRSFYTQLSDRMASNGITFEMSQTRVRNRNTALYLSSYLTLQDAAMRTIPTQSLITIAVKPTGIAHKKVQNLKFNFLPWWIDLREVTLPSQNNR